MRQRYKAEKVALWNVLIPSIIMRQRQTQNHTQCAKYEIKTNDGYSNNDPVLTVILGLATMIFDIHYNIKLM